MFEATKKLCLTNNLFMQYHVKVLFHVDGIIEDQQCFLRLHKCTLPSCSEYFLLKRLGFGTESGCCFNDFIKNYFFGKANATR